MSRPHNPVMPVDFLVAVGGAVVLIGFGLDWSEGMSGYGSLSVLKVILVLTALLALLEPVVLFATRKSDLPVIWEATLALIGSILLLILAGKAILPPEGGFALGFYVVFAGLFIATAGTWTTISREK